MSEILVYSCLWVIVGALTIFLPMSGKIFVIIAMLISGPTLIFLIWQTLGWTFGLPVLLAFLSVTRHPLNYFRRRFMGLPVDMPPDVVKRLR